MSSNILNYFTTEITEGTEGRRIHMIYRMRQDGGIGYRNAAIMLAAT